MNPRKASLVAFIITCWVLVAFGFVFGANSLEPGKLFGETVGRHAFTAAGVVYVITWLFNAASRGE